MVAKTSRAAYEELRATGKEQTQRAIILQKLLAHPRGYTRRQLATITGMELGAVAGRVNKLAEEGLVREEHEIICDHTKRLVKLVEPVTDQQAELF